MLNIKKVAKYNFTFKILRFCVSNFVKSNIFYLKWIKRQIRKKLQNGVKSLANAPDSQTMPQFISNSLTGVRRDEIVRERDNIYLLLFITLRRLHNIITTIKYFVELYKTFKLIYFNCILNNYERYNTLKYMLRKQKGLK